MMLIDVDNNEKRFIAKLLLAQAGAKDCDCDHECNCLVIEEMSIDVDCILIKTKRTVYKLKCSLSSVSVKGDK